MVTPRAEVATSTVFGSLVVTGERGLTARGRTGLVCRCECGTLVTLEYSALKSGQQSCGCRRIELLRQSKLRHGDSGTRTYNIWKGIHKRCSNTRAANFKDYGGRGITVCDRWQRYELFRADMGLCPDGLSIERTNTNGNYEPGNCVWASRVVQNRNSRHNRIVAFDGRRMPLSEACELARLPYATVHSRLALGWDAARALSTPVRGRHVE